MKFFLVFALIAVASASPYLKPTVANEHIAEIQQIVAAINSPSTDPATAIALEALLLETLGITQVSPISVGPAIIDFPLPDGGAVTAVEPTPVVTPIAPSPVVIGEIPAGATPLVQIIVNVAGEESSLITPGGAAEVVEPISPVQVVEQPHVPGPVNVVDNVVVEPIPVSPVQVVEQPHVPGPVNVVDNVVVEPIPVSPVQVVEPIVVSPVQVQEPIVVEPVVVGTPIIPSPVVGLPDNLN